MPYSSITETVLKGVFQVQPKIFGDERGWYIPYVEITELESAVNKHIKTTQIASSFNQQAGILRGLHYQKPNTQGKLVWVDSGSVLDVAVDIRRDSTTFGKYITEKLTASEHNQLWIPPGIAHGYLALEPNTRFTYLISDGRYDPPSEKGINPLDPGIGIDWQIPRENMVLLDRDLNLPMLSDVKVEDLL